MPKKRLTVTEALAKMNAGLNALTEGDTAKLRSSDTGEWWHKTLEGPGTSAYVVASSHGIMSDFSKSFQPDIYNSSPSYEKSLQPDTYDGSQSCQPDIYDDSTLFLPDMHEDLSAAEELDPAEVAKAREE